MQENKITAIVGNIEKVVIGKRKVLQMLLAALIAEGHVLLEDVPGTGKTVMAKSLAKSLQADFSRIQFTPDLLPSDVTGINYYNQKQGEFIFKPGPVFCNVLLADEINRATPRTQSSLLECMEEKQVTVDGVTRELEAPFFVIATQNPIETAGTFPLPEAQLDRFLMQLSMGLPTLSEELAIMERFMKEQPLNHIVPVCEKEELVKLQQAYKSVYIHEHLMHYIAKLSGETRNHSGIISGISPRGTLALMRAAQAYAMVQGRVYVVPEDIKELAVPVLAHRLVVNRGIHSSGRKLIEEILNRIEVPTEEWNK